MFEGFKVVTSDEMKKAEKLAFDAGVKEVDFMLKAAESIFKIVSDYIHSHQKIKGVDLLLGKGNNAGDGFAIAALLIKNNIPVSCFHLYPIEKCSELCRKFAKEFQDLGGKITKISSIEDLTFTKDHLILDALLGTGFSGKLEGLLLQAVEEANESKQAIFAIDIPSGLNGNTGKVLTDAVFADYTIFLGLPKIGFFINQGWSRVGKLLFADFGLGQKYIDQAKASYHLVDEKSCIKSMPSIERTRHKYEAGSIVGISGSLSMEGAAQLAGLAALRSGAGLVRIYLHENAKKELSSKPYEVIEDFWSEENKEQIVAVCNKSKAVFIGPGIGRTKDVEDFLLFFIPQIHVSCVIDADGLFFLAKNPNCLLPKNTILTPHRNEMKKLLNCEEELTDQIFLEKCQKYVDEKKVVLVLKGAPTFIFSEHQKPIIVPRGDPGMATAGTGDVLTGMITALLAQGCSLFSASVLAVLLHAIAGELSAKDKTSYSLIASDLIDHLPKVFKLLFKK